MRDRESKEDTTNCQLHPIVFDLNEHRRAQVTTAENGQKALELLGLVEGQYSKSTRETNINLIITDYCMPGMTGNDLLKRVKGSSNLKEIHVVIVSSENVPTRIKKYKVLKNFC
uniref:Two-component response regulator ARR17-like n=2 Tax=Nicotiana TaxID=4085 RepID=A0A1S3YRP8_TOBAC|nr:PREDICTED: two-component response regulator ARR17-like [Nicotiana sylvestris]XP_016454909.1 PREDICTED: two-component response regulator ARR17-like [Nicotiana tabacum]